MKSVLLFTATVFSIFLFLASCDTRQEYCRVEGAVWNTTFCIKYSGPKCLSDSIQSIFKQVEMSLSPFNENSLVSRINRGDSVAADPLLIGVFEISKWANGFTGGAFDPTLSPLINLWGFGYGKSCAAGWEPSDSLIRETMETVGLDKCYIDEKGYVHKKHPSTTFNFSAVAKGYGCDLIAAMLRRNGVVSYMVEIGGEIALNGLNDRGKPWRVMVEVPDETAGGHHDGITTVELQRGAVATSGNYRNFRETPQGKIGHTISAVTGRPVQTDILSATIVAPSCAMADALATAVMTMPADTAMQLLDRVPDDIGYILVRLDGDRGVSVVDRVANRRSK